MRKFLGLVATVAFSVAAVSFTYAQGRHDERPHGTQKPPPQTGEAMSPGGPMGRHDERPHGPRKPAAKSPDAKGAEAKPDTGADKK